jgi:hypothetical protein
MTLTIHLPDEVAAQLEGLTQEERERYAVEWVRLGARQRPAVTGTAAAQQSKESKRTVLDFAGDGAGRPGAVGNGVEAHIDRLRDEWEGAGSDTDKAKAEHR